MKLVRMGEGRGQGGGGGATGGAAAAAAEDAAIRAKPTAAAAARGGSGAADADAVIDARRNIPFDLFSLLFCVGSLICFQTEITNKIKTQFL